MTPGARLQAAIEIIDALNATAQAADKFLRDWFSARRYAGSKDRFAVTERVYDVLRHRASFGWRMAGTEGRSLVLASLLAERLSESAIAEIFSGAGYGPAPLSEDERRSLASPPQDSPPLHIRGEYPEWLAAELHRAFGAELLDEMQALNQRASIDLRVNSLRAERDTILEALRSLDVDAQRTRYAPSGIRVASAEGLGHLQHTQFFQTGAFEFQDEASQIVAYLCEAKPGQRVLDLAAGAGGKSLALAALMHNAGEILAFDSDVRRMKPLGPRARRAGATNIRVAQKRGGHDWGNGKFDVALVDAPCSGSGTWRRNPELKWRLTPDRLKDLTGLQDWLIDDGARHTKTGGRLIYATCSLLPCENEDVIESFLNRNKAFRVIEAVEVWRRAGLGEPPAGIGDYFRASPHRTATDGFFACIMERIE